MLEPNFKHTGGMRNSQPIPSEQASVIGLMNFIEQLNRNFGRRSSALNRVYAVAICFNAVAFEVAFQTRPAESVFYPFCSSSESIKATEELGYCRYRTNFPLKRNARTCSEHFVNAKLDAKGRRLYPDEVPSLPLPSSN